MNKTEKIIFVYENWLSNDPSLVGMLNTSFIRGSSDTIEYMRPAFSN
ncbi:MAG: hypothetical protein ACYCYI_04015 [Saccharofermentanales bacterium]